MIITIKLFTKVEGQQLFYSVLNNFINLDII